MKKKIIISILILVASLCAFADSFSNPLQFKLRLYNKVDESVNLSFTDGHDSATSSVSLDSTLGLDYVDVNIQAKLVVTTNMTSAFTLYFTFSPMTLQDDTSNAKYLYEAHVYTSSTAFKRIAFDSNDISNVTIEINGTTSTNARTDVTTKYPMTFSFENYLTTYSGGTYSGTITVEVEKI